MDYHDKDLYGELPTFTGANGMRYINAYDARKPHECAFERICADCYARGMRKTCPHQPEMRSDDEGYFHEVVPEPPTPWEMHAVFLVMLGLQKQG